MYAAVTAGYIDAMRFGAFIVAARLTIYFQGQTTGIVLPVSAGQFTIDRNSATRRTGEITAEILPTVPPQTITFLGNQVPLIPIDPTSPLAPFGTEVLVELAIMNAAEPIGKWGWVPMGVYEIGVSEIIDTGIDLTATLQLYDRSWMFSRWGLLSNYPVPATASGDLEDEVVALLSYVWQTNGPGRPSAGNHPIPNWLSNPNFQPLSWVCPPGIYNQGEDPWQACQEMAAAAGAELFFDINGVLTSKPIPGGPGGAKLDSLPVVWNFYPGEVTAVGTLQHDPGGTPYTTPASIRLKMTSEHITNDVYVSATGPSNSTGSNTPQQAKAVDNNPASPTYVNSGIGDIPTFIYDSNINGLAAAQAEADYNLGISISSAYQLFIAAPMNPLLDIDDVVTATQPRVNLDHRKVIIDTITVSIRYDEETVLGGRIILPGT